MLLAVVLIMYDACEVWHTHLLQCPVVVTHCLRAQPRQHLQQPQGIRASCRQAQAPSQALQLHLHSPWALQQQVWLDVQQLQHARAGQLQQ